MSKRGYRHFAAMEGLFYNSLGKYRVMSANNFSIDISKLHKEFRLTRFVRDPRDLVVSGYYYHLRGAEPWFRHQQPTARYWSPINGNVPIGIPPNYSYSEFLKEISQEEGLIAEIEFRKYHFKSMLEWPEDDRIKVFRYEDIVGNESEVFSEILRFYECNAFERKFGVWLADRFSSKNTRKKNAHIRNSSAGQWRKYFTPKVNSYFTERYGKLIEALGYEGQNQSG